MSTKPHIFVDVTQLVHWPGKLAGIPRVMNELAIRFAEDSNVRFMVWVKDLQELCEIDFPQTMAQRGQGIMYLHEGQTVTPVAAAATVKPDQNVAPFKRRAVRLAKRGAKRLLRYSPALEAKAKSHGLQSLKKIQPARGDILFIPWGEWWNEDFMACLLQHHRQGAKLVQVIHDIGPTVWPQFFEQVKVSPATYNAQILPAASLVLSVSENTKRELVLWLKQNKLHVPLIKVIRNGDDIKVATPLMPQDEYFATAKLSGNDYLLCIGTIEAKKNHMLFYYVYKLAKARGIQLPKLVIVGRRGWRTEDIYEIMTHDPEVSGQFVFLHNVGDEELAWLYDHCIFTVLASFHEGWGIPVAESLARGVPCLCSNTSSLVEIAPGITKHFSPASPDECLAAIQTWLDPKALAEARQQARRYKPTTWDQTYQQVRADIEEIL